MQDRRICLLIPSLQAGGMERVMAELAEFFCQKSDLEIHMILYGNIPEIYYKVPVNLRIHKPKSDFNNKARFFNSIGRLFYIRQIVRKIRPDTVLSFGEYWNSFVLIALSGLRYPIYISDRCSPEKKFSRFHTLLRNLFYPKTRGIIAQTEKAREIYLRQFKHPNIIVIGNPIRTISGVSELERENIVLMVGRLIKSKHQDKLIELFLDLDISGWKLVLVGYDHLKQSNFTRLQSIIDQYNARNNVMLVGKQSDVDSFYSLSKIFAFTSSSEGFPNVIGEAMSAGLPVVAFDCVAGPSDMIKDGHNGFLITLFDFAEFQRKLELLMKNDDLRIRFGENARADIKQFSVSIVGEKYLQFIMGNSNE